jgi:diguanylate cyclase (GGDEF)-like protein/PAS domain S-box-containing protein
MVGGTSEGRIHPGAMGAAAASAVAILPAAGGPARAPKFSLSLTLIAFAIFLLGLLWSAVIVHLREEREVEIRNAMKNTSNLARVFEEHTLRTLREADQVLLFMLDMYREQGGKVDLRRLAEDGPISNRIYTYFSIIDEHGMLAAGSRPFTPVDLSDREHFRAHVARDTNQLFIGQPVVGRASGKTSIQLSRRINKPDLTFGGVAVVSVDPEYFSRFYSQLDLGKRGVVTLVGRDDATVRARRSGEDTSIGQGMRNTPLFSHLRTSEHGSFMTASAMDGIVRILSYRALADYPLVVAVGVATDEALTSFNELGRDDLLAAALVSLLILGFTAYFLMLVSRRQHAETTLHQRNIELAGAAETNARLAAIVESSKDAIVSRALDGTILSWNAGAEKLFGYAAGEAVGRSITIIAPPERQHEPAHDTWLLQQGKTVPSFETVCVSKDGRTVHVQASVSAIRDDTGNVTHIAAIFRDIAERKQADEARARLASIVADSSDAIIGRTLDGVITSWNAAAALLLGYSAAEAIGQPITLILPPGHEAEAEEHSRLLLEGSRIPPVEVVRQAKDGRLISVLRSISPIRNSAGALIGASITIRDVSVLKQAEREITHKAALTELMESLARAANEAATPEEALRACVARICDHGNWLLGRVGTFELGQPKTFTRSSIWHGPQNARFEEFINASDNFDHTVQLGTFVHTAIWENRPVWVSDLSTDTGFRRMALAAKVGLRSGFVFPVIVGKEVAAFLEFFATEVREPDALFLAEIGSIGSQLARVIERQHALDEARASKQKLDGILGALHEVVWSMEPRSGRLLYLNAAAKRLTRRPVNDFLANARLWRRMIHPDDRASVRASVRKLMQDDKLTHEFRIVLADGEVRTVENRTQVVRSAEGTVQRIDGTITDITERKQAEERIDHLAQYDAVTGLPNRRLFNDRLTLALARDKRLGAMTAVLLLDLDRFKQINESLGHRVGDKVLQAVTARLTARLREVDTVARLGGDEFAVILESVIDNGQAFCVAEKLVEMMAEPITLDGEEVFVTASVGVAVCPADADTVEKLIEHAELAMYRAKDEGRNTVQAYVPVQGLRHAGLGIESKLRRAIERDELLLHYQPKVDIKTGAIVGAEALVRWRNPELGLVSPADFIPLAEETGLIVPIGEWVLHSACTQAAAWHRQGYPIGIAVNLSARQFRLKNLCELVKETLADCALDAGSLEIEITESMIMHRPEQTVATLQQLHDIGVKLSVDDFGTGYSSLSYLKRFPVNNLKIDQSFVRDLHNNADDAAIVRTVIALAQSMNLKTIAEGVETEQQLIYLAGLHCDEYQGYYFSRPVPPTEFLRLLQGAVNLKALSAQSGVAATAGRDRDQAVPA